VVVEPFVVGPAGSGTTRRYVLPRKLRSVSWAVVALDHHYPTHQTIGVIPCRSEHLKIRSLISTCSESHPETHNSNILYETCSR
jgi:hypothetical protein